MRRKFGSNHKDGNMLIQDVSNKLESFSEADLHIINNEVLYQMKCLRDTSSLIDSQIKDIVHHIFNQM